MYRSDLCAPESIHNVVDWLSQTSDGKGCMVNAFLCLFRCTFSTVLETPVSHRWHKLYSTDPQLTIRQPSFDAAASLYLWITNQISHAVVKTHCVPGLETTWVLTLPRPGKQRPSGLCYQISLEGGFMHDAHCSNYLVLSLQSTQIRCKWSTHSCLDGLFTQAGALRHPCLAVSLSFVMSVVLYGFTKSPPQPAFL